MQIQSIFVLLIARKQLMFISGVFSLSVYDSDVRTYHIGILLSYLEQSSVGRNN